jgi:hypothetical protein
MNTYKNKQQVNNSSHLPMLLAHKAFALQSGAAPQGCLYFALSIFTACLFA